MLYQRLRAEPEGRQTAITRQVSKIWYFKAKLHIFGSFSYASYNQF